MSCRLAMDAETAQRIIRSEAESQAGEPSAWRMTKVDWASTSVRSCQRLCCGIIHVVDGTRIGRALSHNHTHCAH